MSDTDHLALVVSHLLHDLCHLLCSLATDTCINLIKDDGRQLDGTTDHCLQGEHHSCNLTTRGHLRDGLEWGGGVGTEEEGHLVLSTDIEWFLGHLDAELHIGHTQGHQSSLHFFLYLLGCLCAQLGQCLCCFLSLSELSCQLLLQFCQGLVAVLDAPQLYLQFVALCYQFLDCLHVVFLLQVIELVESVVDGIQLSRIKVYMFHLTADLLCDILQFYVAAVQSLHEFTGIRQYFLNLSHGREGCPQRLYDTRLLCREGIVGLVESTLDLFRVRHRLTLLFQFLLLASSEIGLSQLLELELQEIGILPVLLDAFLEGAEFLLCGMILRIGLLVELLLFLVACNDVDHVQLEILLVEQQVLMLRMDVHQLFAEFFQQG